MQNAVLLLFPGRSVAVAVGGRRRAAVGDAAAPFPQELKPTLMGVTKDGELVVAEIGELKDKLLEGPGTGGAADDLVGEGGETGPAKPEAERGRVVVPHVDEEDGGVRPRPASGKARPAGRPSFQVGSRSGRQLVEGRGPGGRAKAGASQTKKESSEERGRESYPREEEVRRASDAAISRHGIVVEEDKEDTHGLVKQVVL